jgi:hypothetical protein
MGLKELKYSEFYRRQLFRDNLRLKYDMDVETLWINYHYVGDNTEKGKIKWKQNFPDEDLPDEIYECICEQHIKINAYITTIDNKIENVKIIGKCCAKHFLESGLKRLCNNCNKPHSCHLLKRGTNEINDNLCIECKKNFKKCKSCNIYTHYRELNKSICRNCNIQIEKKFIELERQEKQRKKKIEIENTIIKFGKYKKEEKTYKWIKENDKEYCNWLINKEFTDWKPPKILIDYLKEN